MKRRIVTAREQAEMLAPWRTAATELLPDNWERLMMPSPDKAAEEQLPSVPPKEDSPQVASPETDTDTCLRCNGAGRKKFHVCNGCFGTGSTKDQDPLERRLYDEFMKWWPTSLASKCRSPGNVTTNWSDHPNEPLTHWLNAEDFMKEKYPDSATGGSYGYEDAGRALSQAVDPKSFHPEEWERSGYTGTGNVITQALLNLHNKLQGRTWASDFDKQRYMELMLKHFGPGAKRLARLVMANRRLSSVIKTSMPAPSPEGLRFQPGTGRSEGLGRTDAYVGEDPVGYLEWLDDNNPWSMVTSRKPGEVAHIFVNPNSRRQNIATEMFDWTKNNLRPDLHHSERRTSLGDSWVNHEQSRAFTGRRFWADSYRPVTIADFFQWCGEKHLRPNRAALEAFSQQQSMGVEEFLNLSQLLESMGLDGKYLEILRNAATDHGLSSQIFNGEGEPNEAHRGGWAEQAISQAGMDGKMFRVPSAYKDVSQDDPNRWAKIQQLQRQYSSEAETYANNVLTKNGWDRGPITIEPEDWDTREGGGVAAYKRGRYQIGLAGNHITELTLLHELSHALLDTKHVNYHGHEFKSQLHDLIHQNLGKDAGDMYGEIGFKDISPNQLSLPLFNRNASRRFWAMADTSKWHPMIKLPPRTAMPAKDAYDQNPNEDHIRQTEMPLRENTSGKWYHVSPHKMEPDTIISPGGGTSPYSNGPEPTQRQRDWVWMDRPEAVKQWYYGTLLGQVHQGHESPWAHIYEVEPSEGPYPWNGSGEDGHVSPSARVIREIPTDKYNNFPERLGRFWKSPTR